MTGDRRPRPVRSGYPTQDVPDWLRRFVLELPSASVSDPDGYRVVDECRRGIGWMEPVFDPLPAPSIGRHRTGTCFDIEHTEMREAAVPAIEAMLGGDTTIHEVRHQHNGYHTDLVVADIDAEALLEWDSLVVGRDPLHEPLQRFKTWWYLLENGPKQDAIEDGLYADPGKNRKHVNWLLDHGYVARTSTGAFVGIELPRVAELHAVELKLRDWETALEQAERANRVEGPDFRLGSPHFMKWRDRFGYADYRWVALDAGAIRPALENRDAFEDAGVGLLAVAEGGTVVKHVDAEFAPRGRYTRDRAWAESEVRAALDIDAWLDSDSRGRVSDESGTVQPGLATYTDGGGRQ